MRIISTTLNSNASPLPSAQAVSSGGSFQAVLANAAPGLRAEGGLTHVSSTGARAADVREDKSATRSAAAAEAADKVGTASAGKPACDDQKTPTIGETSNPDTGTVSVAERAQASIVATASTQTAPAGTSLAQAVACPGDAYLQQRGAIGPMIQGSPESLGSVSAGSSATESGTVHIPAKQDRSKSQADGKLVTTQAAVEVAVGDQRIIPVMSLPIGQGLAHGQQSYAQAGSMPKDIPAVSPAKEPGKPAATAQDRAQDTEAATLVSGGVAGVEAGTAIQESGGSFGGFESLVLSGIAGPASAGNAGGVQGTGKSLEKGATAVDGSASANVSVGAGSSDGLSAGAGASSLHAGVSGSQQPSSVPQDPKVSVTVVRAIDNASLQGTVQTMVHDGGSSRGLTTGVSDPAHTAKAENQRAEVPMAPGEWVASSGINSAKVIQTMGQTEMHVGMHSEEFGDISIRTSLSQQQMVTQISLAHTDLSQELSTHLSAAQAKLGEEYGLHASIEISNQGASLASGQGDSQQSEQQLFGHPAKGDFHASAEVTEGGASVVALSSAASGHGLDIRV